MHRLLPQFVGTSVKDMQPQVCCVVVLYMYQQFLRAPCGCSSIPQTAGEVLCKNLNTANKILIQIEKLNKYHSPLKKKKKTLNKGYRKREILRILQENMKLNQRLHQSKPHVYAFKQWKQEMSKKTKLARDISTYPYQLKNIRNRSRDSVMSNLNKSEYHSLLRMKT